MILPLLLFALPPAPARAAQSPERAWTALTRDVRAEPRDLGVRPGRFAPTFPVPAVEQVLADPLRGLPRLRRWLSDLSRPLSSQEALRFAAASLGDNPALAKTASAVSCPALPPALRPAVERLAGALAADQRLVARAADSIPAGLRERALAQVAALARSQDVPALDPGLFDELKGFRQDEMEAAARAAAAAVDAALPRLEAAARGRPSGRWTCATPQGGVVVTGVEGGRHGEEELSKTLLEIGLGGASRYDGPAAAAGPGQLRVLVDLGSAVIASTGAAAGSGAFGVGLLYLPRASNARVRAGDLSLGAGLFGVGAAFIVADAARLACGRFCEGAAAFGEGVLSAQGDGASLSAGLAAQGFGLTRGAGVLLLRGARARLSCGLSVPDPRDAKASLGLCQGVGYGPRAFAAGGVGVADVRGDGARLDSGYFAQGAGYWHGLGALFLSGNDASVRARRYDQGSGVHMAAGVLLVDGRRDRFANWGVGPAFGWDLGVGVLESRGQDDRFQADWAAGRGEYNGRSLVYVSGQGNELRMPGLGTAEFRRGAPGYGLAQVLGRGNRVWAPGLAQATPTGSFDVRTSPWGVLRISGGGRLDPEVSSRAVSWPDVHRSSEAAREEAELAALGPRPQAGPAALAWDLYVASHFPFVPSAVSEAAARVLTAGPEAAGDLLELYTPEAFDQDLWIRAAFSALGPGAAGPLSRELAKAQGASRAMLVDLYRYQPAAAAVSAAFQQSADPDWRARKAAAAVLGSELGSQAGGEPGRLRDVRACLRLLEGKSSPQRLAQALGDIRPPELLSLLALAGPVTPRQRLGLLSLAPSPFDPVPPERLPGFAALLETDAGGFKAAFARELEQAAGLTELARASLNGSLSDREPEPEVAAAALVSLGAIGRPDDVGALERRLNDPRAPIREAASFGLAEMGEAAKSALAQALKDPSRRAAAVVAAAQSSDPGVLSLLSEAMRSSDASTRLLAVASLSALQTTTWGRRKDFAQALSALAAGDSSASVRASAAAVLGDIQPAQVARR